MLVAAGAALALTTASIVREGRTSHVRATQVEGAWYLSADDLASSVPGASFDRLTRTLYLSGRPQAVAPARGSRMESRVDGPFADDGVVAVRVSHAVRLNSFQGNAPDPGAHFRQYTVEMKNLTGSAQSLYKVEATLVSGKTHVNGGAYYKPDGSEVDVVDTPPHQSVKWICVFEINDAAHPDAILFHPPFAPTDRPSDILIRL